MICFHSIFLLSFLAFITCSLVCGVLPIKSQTKKHIALLSSSALPFIVLIFGYVFFQNSLFSAFYLGPLSFKIATSKTSFFFLLTCTFLMFCSVLYTIGHNQIFEIRNRQKFIAYLSITLTFSVMGIISNDLISGFVFYELTSITSYNLIRSKDSKEQMIGARKYLLIMISTSTFLFLPALIYINQQLGSTSFDIGYTLFNVLSSNEKLGFLFEFKTNLILATLFFGIAKLPILPIGRWMIIASCAPIPTTAVIHAVAVVNLGAVLALKATYFLIGKECISQYSYTIYGWNWLFLVSITSIIVAGSMACYAKKTKNVLAFSTIAQMSFIGSLIFSNGIKNPDTILFFLTAHSCAKIALFFCVGIYGALSNKPNNLNLKHMINHSPVSVICILISSLSMIGCPPFLGFDGKIFVLREMIKNSSDPLEVTSVFLITALSAIYIFGILKDALDFNKKEITKYTPKPNAIMAMKIGTCLACLPLFKILSIL